LIWVPSTYRLNIEPTNRVWGIATISKHSVTFGAQDKSVDGSTQHNPDLWTIVYIPVYMDWMDTRDLSCTVMDYYYPGRDII